MTAGTILVTGATGTTGSRLTARLTTLGQPVRAASRTPADGSRGVDRYGFDWYDPAGHEAALRGVDRLYLVPPVAASDPAAVMLPFLERARAAGVRRAVLLSSSALPAGGPGAGKVHAALADGLFAEWAVLRPSWFMQNFHGGHAHARSLREHGELVTATGDGRVAFIDADDIAAVAARALTDPEAPCRDLILTGPRALGYAEVAAVFMDVTGRPARHRPVPAPVLRERLVADGLPEPFAALLARLDEDIAAGVEDRVTDEVRRMTGREPRDFRAFAEEAFAGDERGGRVRSGPGSASGEVPAQRLSARS
ncbi:NmrA family NAD(P)-binding protein [Streptomyces mobaraensis]|uniref:NmrA family NAD(P)-binding protein n=1 Tax=Streptomyces mobaraensis TaxID=35621 RepID=UPI0033E3C6CC